MSKYNRTFHLPYSPGSTNDDRISKSVESLLGIDIVISEKLDGENTGITRGGVFARSHAAYTTSPWSIEVRKLHQRIGRDLDEDVFLFGENMEGIHSLEYSNLKSYFYLFAVRDGAIWIPWINVEEYAYLLDVPTVPILFKGQLQTEKELKTLVESLVSKPSQLGGKIEGVVVRNAGMFHNDHFSENVMKWVRKGHVQTDEHWTKNWVRAKIGF
jgi:hypothetical protein